MTVYSMKLKETPFRLIKAGKKTVEARLYDAKRQKIALGDTITFQHNDDETQIIEVKVVGLLRYETFGDMFAHNDIHKFGGDDAEVFTTGMLQYYSQKEQDAHGVLGIEFSIVL